MKYFGLAVCLFFVLALNVGSAAHAKCVSAKCHPEIGTAKYVHGPIGAQECTVCHVVGKDHHPPKKHDLSYAKQGKALKYNHL